jgi:uncharacterized protein (DUF3084 family)
MPLPLAMFIAVASSSAATTTTVSTSAVLGGVAAGAGGTATIGAGIWYFFFKDNEVPKNESSSAYEESLDKQNNMTKKKIDEASEAISIVNKEVTATFSEAKNASTKINEAMQDFQGAAISMEGMQKDLTETTKNVSLASTELSNFVPTVAKLSEKAEQDLSSAALKFAIHTQQLEKQKADLAAASERIEELTENVEYQSQNIEQLTESLKSLSEENDELRTTITVQHQKHQKLEAAAKKAYENNRFFRSALEEVTKGVAPPTLQMQNSSTQTFYQ